MEEYPNQVDILKRVIETWEFDDSSRTKIKKNGEINYYDVVFFPLIDEKNKGVIIRITDVTEQEQLELQVQRSLRMETVGTLAGGLAHDFNNVLGGIIGTISLMKYKLKRKEEISIEKLETYFQTMEESSVRASNMVQQLLTLSKKSEFSFAPVDLNLSIKHVMKIASSTFDKSVKLIPEFTEKAAVVSADPSQIEQVLLNFCMNAEQAMTIMKNEGENWGGNLSISLSRIDADIHFCKSHPEAHKREYWMVSVKDTGVGMGEDVLHKIFTPFYTTKDQDKKKGLGLATVYNIIHQHNGFIDVYSEPGVGSTFNFFLPLVEQNISNNKSVEKLNLSGDGTVLIVDDEIIMRITAGEMLKESGYDVLFATNGREALEIYEKDFEKIDLVLLDMAMPEISGQETYIKMKEINSNVKVVLASGFRQDSRVQKVIDLGVDIYLQKPYTFESLSLAVKKALGGE